MKIWTSEHVFNHPWETVTQAAWRKYPNPWSTQVVGVDVVDRQVVNGRLHTHRLISTQWNLPSWARKIIGTDPSCYASEKSIVDPLRKTMIQQSHNLSFCNYLFIDEKITYTQNPADKNSTLLKQEAIVTVKGVPLTSYLEGILTSSISSNATKGRHAMEWVIDKMNTEITELKMTASKSMDDIAETARRSMDDLTVTTKKSVDDLSRAARKGMGDLQQNLNPMENAKSS